MLQGLLGIYLAGQEGRWHQSCRHRKVKTAVLNALKV